MQRLKEDLDSVWARVWAASADRELLLRKVSPMRKKKTKRQNPLRIVKPEPVREPVLVRERARAVLAAASAADFSPAPVKAARLVPVLLRERARAVLAAALELVRAPVLAAALELVRAAALAAVREPVRVPASAAARAVLAE